MPLIIFRVRRRPFPHSRARWETLAHGYHSRERYWARCASLKTNEGSWDRSLTRPCEFPKIFPLLYRRGLTLLGFYGCQFPDAISQSQQSYFTLPGRIYNFFLRHPGNNITTIVENFLVPTIKDVNTSR